MKITELNMMMEGVGLPKGKELARVPNLADRVHEFSEVLLAFEDVRTRFGLTESVKEFADSSPVLKTFFKREVLEEVFYATKTGYFFEGVPSRLTYLLKKALQSYDTPNKALASINGSRLLPYLKQGVLPEGVTVRTVINNICGYDVRLLTEAKLAVQNMNTIEVYVPGVDMVLVLPKEYEGVVGSWSDLETVCYEKGRGVLIRGQLFRTMYGRLGITEDDFDLRKCS